MQFVRTSALIKSLVYHYFVTPCVGCSFRATLYPCPETPAERREMAIGVMTRIEDLTTVSAPTCCKPLYCHAPILDIDTYIVL